MDPTTQPVETEGFSFEIDPVTPSDKTLRSQKIHDRLRGMLKRPVQSCNDYHTEVCSKMTYQPFLAAVYTSYSLHLPLVLSPDVVWLTISQGIAHHMSVHGERLRSRFVSHHGKKKLTIRVANWVPQSPENPWGDAFRMWTDQIRSYVGEDLYNQLLCQFSTTTDASRIASQIVMMDIFECYFKYHMTAICGIPRITLKGTESDWEQLASRVRSLRVFDIDWWLDRLEPIVDQFVNASKGNIELAHWQRICKLRDAYGGDVINGWVGYFFPYIKQFGQGPCNFKNPMFDGDEGITTHSAPSGLSEVPFEWEQSSTVTKKMSAIGGLVGVRQDLLTKALEPIPGWAVCDAKPIDDIIFRIGPFVIETEKQPLAVEDLQNLRSDKSTDDIENDFAYSMPTDLEQLFRVFGEPFTIRFGENQELSLHSPNKDGVLNWGEEPDEDGFNTRGPFGRTWFVIGQTNCGSKLAINLDSNHPTPQTDGTEQSLSIRSMEEFEIARPICVYSDETIGKPGMNPVISSSITQLIQRLIESHHGKTSSNFFWMDLDFVSLGDATEFTQLEARMPAGGRLKKTNDRKKKR